MFGDEMDSYAAALAHNIHDEEWHDFNPTPELNLTEPAKAKLRESLDNLWMFGGDTADGLLEVYEGITRVPTFQEELLRHPALDPDEAFRVLGKHASEVGVKAGALSSKMS